MATPFFDLMNELNKEGCPISYSDVLLVRDWFLGRKVTPYMKAARKRARNWGVIPRIFTVLETEMQRRGSPMMSKADAIEAYARALCMDSGVDPDSIDDKPGRAPSPAWCAWREQARRELATPGVDKEAS